MESPAGKAGAWRERRVFSCLGCVNDALKISLILGDLLPDDRTHGDEA
jgi:hypothetical protein